MQRQRARGNYDTENQKTQLILDFFSVCWWRAEGMTTGRILLSENFLW
jgi:hypothetical protein